MSTPNFTQKYTIIQLLEPMAEGAEFSSSQWPLHVTVVDTFATEWDVATMAQHIKNVLTDRVHPVAVAKDDTEFGSDRKIAVTLLENSAELAALHADLIKVLQEGGLTLTDPQFALDGFRPHATIQKHARVDKGEAVVFSALSIVDMFPSEDPYARKIIKTIPITPQAGSMDESSILSL